MNDYGLVSIITPSYNCAKFIGETIESIISQTYVNWELLITDDCSSDDTRIVLEKYKKKDSRIKVFYLDNNSGSAVARNTSIANANGRYIAMCDSDDIWFPEKLERQLKFMDSNSYEMSHSSVLTCDEQGRINGLNVAYHKVNFRQICNCDKVSAVTVMYDTKSIGKIYMPLIRKRQDWGWKILLIQKIGCSYGMRETLGIYRLRRNSLSRKKGGLAKYNIGIYVRVLGFSKFHAVLKFTFCFMPAYFLKQIRRRFVNK